MENILNLLTVTHYSGDCLHEEHLQWALRLGSISYQYKELLRWLRGQLLRVGKEHASMFHKLDHSYLNRTKGTEPESHVRRNSIELLLRHVLVLQDADAAKKAIIGAAGQVEAMSAKKVFPPKLNTFNPLSVAHRSA